MTERTAATLRAPSLDGYVWTGVALAAAAVGAAAFSLLFAASPIQSYPEFVVGYLAVAGAGKGADLWAVPAALAATMAAAFLFHRVARSLYGTSDAGGSVARAYAAQLLLAAVPAAFAAGSLLYRFAADVSLFHLSAAWALLVSCIVALGSRRGHVAPRVAGYAVLGVALVALLPAEAALVLDRAGAAGRIGGGVVAAAFAALFALGAAAMLVVSARAPARVAPLATAAIVLGSAALPVTFVLLYPGPFALPSGEVFRYPATGALWVLVAALAAWAWADLGGRVSRARTLGGADPAAVVSPPALFALVVALRYGQTLAPVVSADDFHFGERLLGWWTTLQFGAVPFVDYVSLHGLLEDDSGGFLSALLFDGTAATIAQSDRLAHAGLALLACAVLWRVTGSAVIALCAALSLGGRGAWYLLAPLFCLAADDSLERRPDRWLAIWIVAVPIVLLAVPAQGALALAATAPVAALAAYRWWKSGAPRLRSWPAYALLALAVAAVATPLGRMLVGALRLLVEFGPVNQVAYAVPWSASFAPGTRSAFAGELARMSWIAIPVAAAAAIALYPRDDARRARVVATALPPLLFALALIPYAMGRIDAVGISRPGVVAVFGWSVLIPLLACVALGARAVPALALAIGLGAGALGANPALAPLLHAADVRPLHGDPRAASGSGLAAMGGGVSDAAHRARLLKVKAELDLRLPPGQPYLDLTGRTAQHFYLGRPPVLRIPAPYNLVPASEQRRAVETLARSAPAAALIWADNDDLDGLKLALRAPLLYRFALDAYEPYERDGLVFGRLRAGAAADRPRAESELALLDRVFADRELHWIPVSWGRSAGTLAERMTPASPVLDDSPSSSHDLASADGSYRVTGADPYLNYDVSAREIAPARAGLLKFDFACARPAQGPGAAPAVPRVQIFYWGDAQAGATERGSLYLNAADGTLIVPLDAYPRYLDLARLRGLRFDLDNAAACATITIRNVGLHQRESLRDLPAMRSPLP